MEHHIDMKTSCGVSFGLIFKRSFRCLQRQVDSGFDSN